MDDKKRLRDEVAELSEAVRGLREELAATRKPHGCHGCHCGHSHWPQWYWGPVWCGTTSVSTSSGTTNGYTVGTKDTGYVTTNAIGGHITTTLT